jgi:integrating conjugative element protein (TIGR03755 family)
MKRHAWSRNCTLLLSVVLVVLAPGVNAQRPTGDGVIYYRIGGGTALRPPPNRLATSTPIPASAELGVNYSCLQFDALASLLAGFDRALELLRNIDDVLAAGLFALPMYILQRVNPGLYDLLQNLLLRADELVNIATKTCEDIEREVARGKNPYEDWIVISRGTDWKTVIGSGGLDVVSAKEEIDANVGRSGVVWLCNTRAGGEGQPPILVVEDVTRAGWNALMNRESCATGSAGSGGEETARLVEIWSTPEEAGAWTIRVLGDMVVSTTATPDASQPGLGLLLDYDETSQELVEALRALVAREEPPSNENLEVVSAPGTVITRQVIEAIAERDPAERDLLIIKIAGQVALERTVEKALLARRLLLTGRRDPNVAATPAPRQLEPFLAELERNIDDLLFETRVRREVVSHTAEQVLTDEHRRRAASRGLVAPHEDVQPIDEGAVRP